MSRTCAKRLVRSKGYALRVWHLAVRCPEPRLLTAVCLGTKLGYPANVRVMGSIGPVKQRRSK
jgi:hypothetical protein